MGETLAVADFAARNDGKGLDIALLTPEGFQLYWPYISEQLDRIEVLWKPWYSKEWIFRVMLEEAAQTWVVGPPEAWRVVVMSHVTTFPSGDRVLHVFLKFGTGILDDALIILEPTLQRFAKMTKCRRIEARVRRGLIPKLKQYGARELGTYMSMDVMDVEVH